ncbi:MAG: hypothetical protein HY922_15545 [Elusimicrobia bacterium]|nr:hypothetical protein [Elusimicrobiota bacterium]
MKAVSDLSKAFALAVLLVILPAAAVPAAPAEPAQPSARPVSGAVIERKNVFDPSVPGENWWLFRLANRIHVLTQEHVVRRELLLKPGDPFDPLKALETERNLRSEGFIRKAEVRSDPPLLRVMTQDAWTLKPQLGVGTEGGDNYLIAGLQEDNLLGLGKQVSLNHARIGDERREEARYSDPRLFGTWVKLVGLYTRTARGDEIGTLMERPFFSLETAYSGRLAWSRTITENSLYSWGEASTKFDQNFRTVQSGFAWRLNESGDMTRRAFLGTHYEKAAFHRTVDTAPGTLPSDRELSGPLAGYSWVYGDYIKETEIDRMRRVEDFNLGNEFSARAGPMLSSWGSDRDRWIVSALDQQGLRLGPRTFALAQAGLRGRHAGGKPEDWIFYANLNIFKKIPSALPQTLVAHMEFNTTGRLDKEKQLLLGGNTGLRGYKNNSFTGTRSLLLNFEDRVFMDKEWFHLLYVGGVVFVDSGMTADTDLLKTRVKTDVGFGLRASPSRSASGGVLRIDLAYALNEGPGASRWVVSIRAGQAFSIFNSTNRRILQTPDAVLGEESAGTRLRRE